MKKKFIHTEAANFLTDHALPTDAELDAMDPAQLAAFLSSQGVDVAKLQKDIGQLKQQVDGKLALAHARKQRIAKAASEVEEDLSSMSQEDFIAALKKKFGRVESIPLAARNFGSMKREDWESLYRDHIKR